jgi:hypothetical protein
MMFAGWKAKVSVHLQIPKEDIQAYLSLAKVDPILSGSLQEVLRKRDEAENKRKATAAATTTGPSSKEEQTEEQPTTTTASAETGSKMEA